MPASWSKLRICASLAVILASLSHVLADDPPPLPFAWNPSAKANDWNMFTLHATYPEGTDIDDATVVGLAKQAFNVMRSTTDWNSMSPIKPATAAALKVANEIFFASSITGHGHESFVYDWLTPRDSNSGPSQAPDMTPERKAALESEGYNPSDFSMVADSLTDIEIQLEACRIQQMQRKADIGSPFIIKTRHRTNGNCAEVIALHMYNVKYPVDGLRSIRDKNAVVATWGPDRRIGGTPNLLEGCGGQSAIPKDWGCSKLMESVGVRIIQDMPAGGAKDSTVAPTSVDQINVCERDLYGKA